MPLMIPIAASMLRVDEKMDSIWYAINGDVDNVPSKIHPTVPAEVMVNSLCPYDWINLVVKKRSLYIFLINPITSHGSI